MLITHKHSPKEEKKDKGKQTTKKETYAQKSNSLLHLLPAIVCDMPGQKRLSPSDCAYSTFVRGGAGSRVGPLLSSRSELLGLEGLLRFFAPLTPLELSVPTLLETNHLELV